MSDKEKYKQAIKQLKCHTPSTPEVDYAKLLNEIDRYCGELRRKVSEGKRHSEDGRQKIESLKRQLERLQVLPVTVQQLSQAKCNLESQRDSLQHRIEKLEAEVLKHPVYSSGDGHTQIKSKCLECGLHFMLFTWTPEEHGAHTLTCPECGQSDGQFIIWHEEGQGMYQETPR